MGREWPSRIFQLEEVSILICSVSFHPNPGRAPRNAGGHLRVWADDRQDMCEGPGPPQLPAQLHGGRRPGGREGRGTADAGREELQDGEFPCRLRGRLT